MNDPSTVQVSAALLCLLLSLVPPAKPRTVLQLRRLAVQRGIRGFNRDGQRLPIKAARRSELIALLQQ